jgi:hypothetical protein
MKLGDDQGGEGAEIIDHTFGPLEARSFMGEQDLQDLADLDDQKSNDKDLYHREQGKEVRQDPKANLGPHRKEEPFLANQMGKGPIDL